MQTITISRQFGSGGDEISLRVCELLGYQRFDKHMVIQAASQAGISEHEVIDYSEEKYRIRSFLERLFSRAPTITTVRTWEEHAEGILLAEDIELQEGFLVNLVQKAVQSAHERGSVVVVGRGGQALLRDEKDVLHVRIIAPMEDRIQRVKERLRKERQAFDAHIDLRRDAQDLILNRDAASADYLRRFYSLDWNDPSLYHVVLNTGKFTTEQASLVISDLVDRLKLQTSQEAREVLPV